MPNTSLPPYREHSGRDVPLRTFVIFVLSSTVTGLAITDPPIGEALAAGLLVLVALHRLVGD